jgi:uncharacterized protein YjdB
MFQFVKKFSIGIVILSLTITGVFLSLPAEKSSAVTASDWNAGNIISDDQFFNSGSMSTSDIQNFLNSMVPTCDTNGTRPSEFGGGTRAQYGASVGKPAPYTCLKDYVENPNTHQNNANGGSVSGGWSSAQIIKYASDTYNINPKALIVLLQKEQALVTDTWPFPGQYRSATGYGCPDTAPCDAEYYGLYNQVVNAARQFQLYAKYPASYRYKAYQNNTIQWNPSSSCGSSTVYIANQATAGLYNYTPYQPNQSALNNLYGTGDSCGAYGNRNFWRLYSDWFGSTQTSETFITSRAHVGGIGWMSNVTNNGVIGTTGQTKAIEGFRIDGSIEYSSYSNTVGWQPTVGDGMVSGTTAMSRPIQAIKINPNGALANRYDVYYRTHITNVGWLGWTKNGQISGVTGDSDKNIEAIEIRLVVKGYSAPGSTDNAYQNFGTTTYAPPVSLSVTSHVGEIGWQQTLTDSMVSGTTDKSKRIEAIKIALNSTTIPGGISYSGYISDMGWQDFKSNNEVAGTTGQSRRMEAIRIALTGQVSESYDIWYRGYVQGKGWMDWVKNGQAAGSMGASYQIEALETRLTTKNSTALQSGTGLFNPQNLSVPESYSLSYSTHLYNIGWTSGSKQNDIAGTTGQSRPMEGLRIDNINSAFGDISISCSAYVKNTGWVNDVTPANTCGTAGQTKSIEAIKLKLTGTAANKYDIYYKIHQSTVGWREWVKNDEQAGVPLSNTSIEAIVIKLVQK